MNFWLKIILSVKIKKDMPKSMKVRATGGPKVAAGNKLPPNATAILTATLAGGLVGGARGLRLKLVAQQP